MKKKKRKNLWKRAAVFMLAAALCVPQLGVSAETEYNFKTSYTIHDGANECFIVEDSDGKYGLLNEEGENVSENETEFQYDSMEFLADSQQYSYVKVKKGDAYGILDLEGNEVIETGYDEIDAFKDDNTVAAAFNGADTELFDTDGKEYGKKLSGKYSVISDTVFLGETDIVNENGNRLLNLQKESMLDADGKANVVKMGEYYAIQKYFTEPDVVGENLKADQYVLIYKDDDKPEEPVMPMEDWGEDEGSASITASLKLVRGVSDTSILLQMDYGDEKENFYVIYDMEKDAFSEKFEMVGKFTDGKAFAKEFKGDAFYVIDEKGEETEEISIPDGYEVETESLKDVQDTALLRLKKSEKDTDSFKLCAHDGEVLDQSWKEAEFLGNSYTRVKNDDGKYAILDAKGNEIVAYGEFTEDVIKEGTNIFCSNTGITIKKQSGDEAEIYYYATAKKEEKSFFEEHKLQIIIGAAVAAVLLILIIVIVTVRKRKRRALEEQLERKRREEMKRKPSHPNIPKHPNISDAPGGQINRGGGRSGKPIKRPMNSHSDGGSGRKTGTGGSKSTVHTSSGAGGYLTGIAGECAGAVIRIGDGSRLKLGRDSDCDVILKNPKVSRRHCIIGYDGKSGKYQVVDYSTNGVYLSDGRRLPKGKGVWLDEGMVLFIGNDKTVFRLGNKR